MQSTPVNNDNDVEQQLQSPSSPADGNEVSSIHKQHRRQSSFRFPSVSGRSSVHDTTIISSLRQSVADCEQVDEAQDSQTTSAYESLLQKTIQNACNSAFGIIGADVWLYDEIDWSFQHAAYYRHNIYKPKGSAEKYALARIEDTNLRDYVPPTRQIPGSGLAGYFFSICSTHDRTNTWREVRAITSDPDQPPDERTKLLEMCGYGRACGVPFDIRGYRGIVIYLARQSADHNQLSEVANEIHLRVSADLIGAVSCSSITSAASINAKNTRNAKTLSRVRAKMLALVAFASLGKGKGLQTDYENIHTEEEEEDNVKPSLYRRISSLYASRTYREHHFPIIRESYRTRLVQDCIDNIHRKACKLIEKSKGGKLQPPPPMPWVQTIWVCVGVFVTMLILIAVSETLKDGTNEQYGIILGPFGALVTLQYALTAAPASQPRNAIYGQVMSLSIALIVNLIIPASSWVRVPVTTALAISTMCKLAIVHPPAGAAAVLFSLNDHSVVDFAFILVGSVIAILMAILVNNLNEKKQYPIYYAFMGEKWARKLSKVLCFPCSKKKVIELHEDISVRSARSFERSHR
eukprot:scaffold2550_cov153-Skeletonema_menzelii.AAC.17